MKKNLLALSILFSVFCVKAQVGNTLSFDGINDNIIRNVVSTQNTAVTYEARIKAALPSAGNKYIMYNGTNGTNGFGLYLQASTNTVVVKVGASVYTTSYVVPTGTLTLLSIVFTGPNALQVYANGTLVHIFFPSPATAPSGSFAIGSDNAGANFFGGEIDEVRYWNRIVCAAEIMHRSTCQAAGIEPLLVACYNFNQGVGSANNATVTTLIDASSSNYTATLTSFALTGATSNWLTTAGAFSSTCTFAPNTVTVSPSGTLTVCSGSPVNLIATGATSYTWSTLATGATLALTPSATAQYSVVGQSGFCIGMGMKSVSVNPLPNVVASSSQPSVLCIGQSATLTASGATSYTWNPGGTATTIIVSPTVTSSYTLTGVDANTCQKVVVLTQSVANCSGLVQNSLNLGMSVYPNPNSGEFNISLNSISETTSFEMYNLIGELVLTQKANPISTKINISQLPEGIYIVKVKENSTVIATSKIIKE